MRKRKSRAKTQHLSAPREWKVLVRVQPVNAAEVLAPCENLTVRRLSGKGEAEIIGPGSFKVWSDAKPRKGAKSTRTVYEVSADVDLEQPIVASRITFKAEEQE